MLTFRLPSWLPRLCLSLTLLGLTAGTLLPTVRAAEGTPTPGTSGDTVAGGGGGIPNTNVSPYGANIFLHKAVIHPPIARFASWSRL